jgi:CubicO group peptidase (beta-lactamase class C family)
MSIQPSVLKGVSREKNSCYRCGCACTDTSLHSLQTKRNSRDALKNGGGFPSTNSIRARLQEIVPDARNTGIVVGLLHPGGKRQVIAYGSSGLNARPLDGDSVFEIGSITKVFTGVLLADMIQRGEVKLSVPLPRIRYPVRPATCGGSFPFPATQGYIH